MVPSPRELTDAEREVDALRAIGARFVALGEPDYPRPLAAIADPPPLLSMIGHGHLLNKRIVAMSGRSVLPPA